MQCNVNEMYLSKFTFAMNAWHVVINDDDTAVSSGRARNAAA